MRRMCLFCLLALLALSTARGQSRWVSVNGVVDSLVTDTSFTQRIVRIDTTPVPVATRVRARVPATERSLYVSSYGVVYVGGSDGIYRYDPQTADVTYVQGDTTFGFIERNSELWAATGKGLLRSIDSGRTWKAYGKALGSNRVLKFLRTSHDVLYTRTDDSRLFVNTPASGEWVEVYQSPARMVTDIFLINDSLLQWRKWSSFVLSGDSGTTWRDIGLSNGTPIQAIVALGHIISLTNQSISIYREGKKWDSYVSPFNKSSLHAFSLAFESHTRALIAATTRGIYSSEDTGKNWHLRITTPVLQWVTNVTIDSQGGMYATTKDSLIQSTDGGIHWQSIGWMTRLDTLLRRDTTFATDTTITHRPGNEAMTHRQVREIVVQSSNEINVSTDIGFIRTTNGGASWRLHNRGIVSAAHPDSSIWPLAYDPVGIFYTASGNTLFRSSNNGDQWQAVKPGWSSSAYISRILVSPRGFLFVITSQGIFRTGDGGEHWADVTKGLKEVEIRAAIVTSHGALIVHTDFHTYRSTDDGDSWTLLTLFPTMASDMIVQGASGLVLYSPGTYASRDDGENWVVVGVLPSRFRTFAVGPNDEVLVATAGFEWSTDLLEHVTTSDKQSFVGEVTSIAFDSLGNAYAGSTIDGLYKHAPFSSLAVGERVHPASASLYPNPVTTVLHLELQPDASQVRIFDVSGRAVMSALAREMPVNISVADWPNGVYAVVWMNAQTRAIHTERLVVQH